MKTAQILISGLAAAGLFLSGSAMAASTPDVSALCGGGKKADDGKKKDRKNPSPACGGGKDVKKPDTDKKKKKLPSPAALCGGGKDVKKPDTDKKKKKKLPSPA